MSNTTNDLLASISVNLATGAISYPKVPGFTLDMEQVYRTTALFMKHCTTTEQAVKLAIHGQIAAYQGLSTIRGMR